MNGECEEAVKVLAGTAKYPTKWDSYGPGNYTYRSVLKGKSLRFWEKCCGERLSKVYAQRMRMEGLKAPEGSLLRRTSSRFAGYYCLNCDATWEK